MPTIFRRFVAYIFSLYHKFQHLITVIFIFGFIDILLYSDVMMAMFLLPEFTGIITMVSFAVGVYKYFKHRKRRASVKLK